MGISSTRRSFIKTVAAGFVGTYTAGVSLPKELFAAKSNFENGIKIQEDFIVLDSYTQKNLSHLIEVLLPGSNKLGLQNALMNIYSKNLGLAGYVDSGLWNLDALSRSQFGKPFYELKDQKELKRIFAHVQKRNSNARVFFIRFKDNLKEMYYSHPDILKKLNYHGPPQPRGFLNYTKPPTES